MRLELRWDPHVPGVMRRLEMEERRRLTQFIFSLLDNPTPVAAEPLIGKPNWYRIDEGQFRLLYMLDSVEESLVVIAIMKDGEWLRPDINEDD